jgi:hypothetical protein
MVGYNPGALNIFAEADNFWNSSRFFIAGIGYFFDLSRKEK